jgi:hypothetical protein
MSNVELLNFCMWAAKRDPKFTQSRRAHVQALWDWRPVVRSNPALRRVIQPLG